MKITKFGHSCLLVEESGVRILIDPGSFSISQNIVKNIDLILITHEHQDHFFLDSLRIVLKNNPKAKIFTNKSVGVLLEKENINYSVLKNGEIVNEKVVLIEGIGEKHSLMHTSIPPVENVGYLIADKFFYPGDAFTRLDKKVEILALPVAGPWMKLLEAIDYALELSPKVCFPVHEGILKSPGSTHLIPPKVLEPKEIKFNVLEIDKEYEF